eukprot:CAMPEP_0115676410 /NCGR_PEP_ID=MMETSP0272-20121206/54676_1 /TAXON_ID=71861 /ORGANISM="Scrippsiella trochoidea, Strain CCMP3099" /LENGTH=61 /DNA_ID=CAMNT_0003115457 /DNA_START=77 /DNA_END=258 /DNA_ORIENTATION=-
MNHHTLSKMTSGFWTLCKKTSKKPLRLRLFFNFLGGSGSGASKGWLVSNPWCILARHATAP